MKHQWSTDEALAIVAAGWSGDVEQAIFSSALQHVRNVARLRYALERDKLACPTCGHRPDAASHPSKEGK